MFQLKISDDFFSINKTALLLALLTLIILLPLWWWLNLQYTEILQDQQRNQITAEVAARASTLATIVNSRLNHLLAIKTYTDLQKNSDNFGQEFDSFAASLYNSSTGIRNFIVAPGGINTYVYPITGNEAALGHNLLTDSRPNVRADIARTQTTENITISGPYELRQGGLGLVARQAVFERGQFWGIVSMVLDLPPVFTEAGLYSNSSNLLLALKNSTTGEVFFGPENIFALEPVIQEITLVEGSWELASLPAGGWEATLQPNQTIEKYSTLAIVMLFTLLVYSTVNRQTRLSDSVNQRTRQLIEANVALQQEIAERKQFEQQLAFQARLLDSVQEAISATDMDGIVTYWNKHAEKLYDITADAVINQHITTTVAPEAVPAVLERISLTKQNGQWRGQYKQHLYNDNTFWTDVIISVVQNEQGDPIGLIGIDRDISELKQIETDLIASEQKYRLLAENSTDVIAVVDVDLNISYISPAVERYFGYTLTDLLGYSLDRILTPKAFQEAQQLYTRLNKEGFDSITSHTIKMEHHRKEGSICWCEIIFSPILDDDQFLSMLVTLRDITERQLAENALLESERRFRDVLENVDLAALMLDRNGRITFCNNFLLKLTNWHREEIMGQNWFNHFISADIRAEILGIFTKTINNGQFPPHHQNAIITRSGEERIINWSNTAYRDARGQIIGVTSLGIDITEQQQTLVALQESESRHRAVSELISDYVYSAIVYPDGSTKTEWVSGPFTHITGLPVEAITSQSNIWINHVVPEDRAVLTQQVNQVINNIPVVVEYRIITGDSKICWLRDHMKPIWSDTEQRVIRLVGGIKNITEQKQTTNKLRESLHEKEVMLKEIHHRVKNNLQIITSLLSLQADTIQDEITRQALFDSRSRVRSMALVHEMLYLSDNLAQIDIDPYFQSVAKNLFSIFQTPETRAVLECTIDPIMLNLDTAIPCGLIVNELISNALKHAFPAHYHRPQPETQNKILLQFTRVAPNHLQLLVSDNGIGISKDIDLHNTQSLGLQLVNILTTQLNGQIEIINQSGTTFKVIFAAPA